MPVALDCLASLARQRDARPGLVVAVSNEQGAEGNILSL